ncbi:MAG: HEAT repeat domain-containing protein [Elusimicrobia bacterium]|nr:HEAT repeat domain-containing protein [Elusimicrobiota bacterium]
MKRLRYIVAALALWAAVPARAAAPAASASAAFLAATWEVLMYDHVDLRDGAWILETSGLDVDGTVSQLAVILRDPVPHLGVQAAGFLALIGPRSAAAVPALAECMLDDRSADLRFACARALGRVGPGARAAAIPLASALKDADPVVRAAAARALGRIGKDSPVLRQALKAAAQDQDAEVRRSAGQALVSLVAGQSRL